MMTLNLMSPSIMTQLMELVLTTLNLMSRNKANEMTLSLKTSWNRTLKYNRVHGSKYIETQHNEPQLSETQHIDINHKVSQHNDTRQNDTYP